MLLICVAAPPNIGMLRQFVIDDPKTLIQIILELESETVYRIEVEAETQIGGRGSNMFADGETLPADREYFTNICCFFLFLCVNVTT